MLIRLQKFLADSGIASRRKGEELIKEGKVKVNGATVTELGLKIDESKDVVLFNNKEVKKSEELEYLLLHKPKGYITTVRDQFGRKSIMELIDTENRLFPVGRLDYDTSGLLIITNDGELTYKLTHPKHNVEKTYVALVRGIPSNDKLDKLKKGIKLEEFTTAPAKVKIIETKGPNAVLEIKIREGKNRQVRRMCEAIGHFVIELKRTAIGEIVLSNIKEGEYRSLSQKEIGYLKRI